LDVVTVESEIPVFKSIGLFQELQSATSGNLMPKLEFSHWEVLDFDAHWRPTTSDEIEDFGQNESSKTEKNLAKIVVDAVRKSKGLRIKEVLVKDSDKQRTLSK
ncbi:MAG: Cytoplasmic GTPase/eEF2-like protein (ribosomal biogenesis), partial [Paramarteilia canceri]